MSAESVAHWCANMKDETRLVLKDEDEMDGEVMGPLFRVCGHEATPVRVNPQGNPVDWWTYSAAAREAERLNITLDVE